MPKPQIVILNQGLCSLTLVKQTGLSLSDAPGHVDYVLGYGTPNKPLKPDPIDRLSADSYLQLQPTNKTQGAIWVDGLQGTLGFRRHPGRLHHEPLIKAIGANHQDTHPLKVIDATAGWGTDAFLLASVGCHLHLIEADSLVGVLLADGLRRWHAAQNIPFAFGYRPFAFGYSPMSLSIGHAVDLIPTLAAADFPDVIYLDPMFPARQKTAAVKKNMAFLQRWLGKTEDKIGETLLLETARRYAKKRVVVKRPQSAPHLAGVMPSGAITTRHHRYDIYPSSFNLQLCCL